MKSSLFRIMPYGLAALLLLNGLAACTHKSGTRLSSDGTSLQSIKSLQLSVTTADPYTIVQSDGHTAGMVGGVAFGVVGALVGAGIDSARSSSKSSTLEESVASYLQGFDATELLSARVQTALEDSHRFDRVEKSSSSTLDSIDGTLTLEIETWGLRSCIGGTSSEHMQVEFQIEGRLMQRNEGRAMWERTEVYRDPVCRPFSEFRDQPTLLRERLTQSLETISGLLVNRILYPE